ncbi:TIGR03545 family protein [bacterium]
MMRWKAFIPIVIIFLALTILYLFFIDTILARAFIKTNQLIFQAKTEVEYFDFNIKDFSLEIRGYKVTDKDDPMKNLFEIGRIHGDLKILPLLEKKIVINELAVQDMSFNTLRSRSGALKKKAKKKTHKKEKERNEAKSKIMPEMSLDFDLDKIVKQADISGIADPKNLESVKIVDEIKNESNKKAEEWEKRIGQIDFKNEIDNSKQSAKELKEIKKIDKIEDIALVKKKIDILKSSKKGLDTKLNSIKEIQQQFETDKDYFSSANITRRINEAKKLDYNKLLAGANLKQFNVNNMSKSILGPALFKKIQLAEKWGARIRKYMPKKSKHVKKEGKEKYKKKKRGTIVDFPKHSGYPKFLVKQVNLSGKTKIDEKNTINIQGKVLALTSNQDLYNAPTTITIKGNNTGANPYKVSLSGIFDYMNNQNKESLSLKINDLSLKGLSLGTSATLPPSFEKGNSSLNMAVVFHENGYNMNFGIIFKDISFKESKKSKNEMQNLLSDVYKNMNKITVNGSINKTDSDSSFKLSSNIDEYLKKHMQEILNKRIDSAKAKLRAHLDKETSLIKRNAEQEIYNSWNSLDSSFQGRKTQLQDQINVVDTEIKEKEKVVTDKLNEQKRKLEAEKKKKQDELKNKTKDKLKSLLK